MLNQWICLALTQLDVRQELLLAFQAIRVEYQQICFPPRWIVRELEQIQCHQLFQVLQLKRLRKVGIIKFLVIINTIETWTFLS